MSTSITMSIKNKTYVLPQSKFLFLNFNFKGIGRRDETEG